MDLTAWLDVAIGLSVVYLGASLFVTIIGEQITQVLNLRGRVLWTSIRQLFSDADLRARLEKNPVLKAAFFTEAGAKASDLEAAKKAAPAYVDPVVVARALLRSSGAGGAAELPPALKDLVGAVGETTNEMVAAVEHWVDSSLTALGGAYRKYVRRITLGISLAVAMALNIDTVALTVFLYKDKAARDATVAVAIDVTSKLDQKKFDACMTAQRDGADAGVPGGSECAVIGGLVDAVRLRNQSLAKLPIGRPVLRYSDTLMVDPLATEDPWWGWPVRVMGWLLTTLALSLGAPFWFNALAKVVNLRGSTRKPGAGTAAGGGAAAPGPLAATVAPDREEPPEPPAVG